MNDPRRVLVLAPHTDDGEIGCGGSIARLVGEGKSVFYIAFSAAEQSLPEGVAPDILRKEAAVATAVLGVPGSQLTILSYPVRAFSSLRQEILEDMVRLRKQIEPDLVFLPSSNDTHQDHETIFNEGFRAFKRVTMLGYELPWNNRSFEANTFITLRREHIDRKVQAIKCYQSQQNRRYSEEEFIRGWARTRGTQVFHEYAEVFESVRWIIR